MNTIRNIFAVVLVLIAVIFIYINYFYEPFGSAINPLTELQEETANTYNDLATGISFEYPSRLFHDDIRVTVLEGVLKENPNEIGETPRSYLSVLVDGEYNNVGGRDSYNYRVGTATGYINRVLQIEKNDRSHIEIVYSFGNSDRLRGEIELSDEEWNDIISSISFN